MCLSVPLFAIQTFPLFLSFGIFLNFSPCRVLGSEGLAAPRGSGGSAGGQEDRRAGAGALSPPGWVWLCWAPGKVSRVSRSSVKRLGQAGGVSSKDSPHSLQDWQRPLHPSLKLPRNPPREGETPVSSSSSEQSPAFPVALCTFGHFLEEMGRPQVLHNLCTDGSFLGISTFLQELSLRSRPNRRTPLFTCLNQA